MSSFLRPVSSVDWRPFAKLYITACLLYYLATWWGYGGFSGGHPPIWDVEEFFASSGLKFVIYLSVSLFLLVGHKYFSRLNSWLKIGVAGLVFLAVTTLLQELVLGFFGYVQFFGGKLSVFNHLFTVSFFALQGMLFIWIRDRRLANVEFRYAAAPGGGRGRGVQRTFKEQEEPPAKPVMLFGGRGKTRVPLPIKDLSHIIACRNYATAQNTDGSFLLDFGIGEAENRLLNTGFIRVHRSYLVNLAHLEFVEREGRGHRLVLTGGDRVPVGAKYLKELRELGY